MKQFSTNAEMQSWLNNNDFVWNSDKKSWVHEDGSYAMLADAEDGSSVGYDLWLF